MGRSVRHAQCHEHSSCGSGAQARGERTGTAPSASVYEAAESDEDEDISKVVADKMRRHRRRLMHIKSKEE
jgi:hypothetical protein